MTHGHSLSATKVAVLLAAIVAVSSFVPDPRGASMEVVISQVYGGGGNSGAPLTHDFVELHNLSDAPVSVDGWSIQYASATGTGHFGISNQITALSGSIAPGGYLLVQEAGGANGVSLPTPDVTGSIAMAAGAGKVALVSTSTSLGCNGGSTACPPIVVGLTLNVSPTVDVPAAPPLPEPSIAFLGPNPTSGPTRIGYALPGGGHVRLTVCDLQGRLVARPVDGWRPAGDHQAIWEPGLYGSGLYFLRLEYAGRSVTRRLALIR